MDKHLPTSPDKNTQLAHDRQRDYRSSRRPSLTASWSEAELNNRDIDDNSQENRPSNLPIQENGSLKVRRTRLKVPNSPLPPPPMPMAPLSPSRSVSPIPKPAIATPPPAARPDVDAFHPQNPMEGTFGLQDDELPMMRHSFRQDPGFKAVPQRVHHPSFHDDSCNLPPQIVPMPHRPSAIAAATASKPSPPPSIQPRSVPTDSQMHAHFEEPRGSDESSPSLRAIERHMASRAQTTPPENVRKVAISGARDSPSSKSLSGRVMNFRDLGASVIKLGLRLHKDRTKAESEGPLPGVVFRSAELGSACEHDIKTLFSSYGIRTIIDLRSELEARASDIIMHHYPASIQPTADQSLEKLMKLRAVQVRNTIVEVAAHDYESAARPWEKIGESHHSWSRRNSLRYTRSIGDPKQDALARALAHLYDEDTGPADTQNISSKTPYVPQEFPEYADGRCRSSVMEHVDQPDNDAVATAAAASSTAADDFGYTSGGQPESDNVTTALTSINSATPQPRIAQTALDWGTETIQSLRSYWDQEWLNNGVVINSAGQQSDEQPQKQSDEKPEQQFDEQPEQQSKRPETPIPQRSDSSSSKSSDDSFYRNSAADAQRDAASQFGLRPVEAAVPAVPVAHLGNPMPLHTAVGTTIDDRAPLPQAQHEESAVSPLTPASSTSTRGLVVTNKFDGNRRRYRCNVIGENYRKKCVWANTPWSTRIKVILRFATFNKAEAIRTIGREVLAPRGLAGSYEDYVDYCKDEFATVLRIFADPAAYPILFHCQHGKDRTGIVAMLLLGILGVDDDIIAADYALSQKNLETVRDRMILLDMGAVGLPESFCDSPASAMHNLLRHIRAKYGSVRGYLLSAGLREQEINTIAWCLRGNFCGIARAKSRQAQSNAHRMYLRPTAARSEIFNRLESPGTPSRFVGSRSHSVDVVNAADP
ncbi:hypothetical protein LPJ66_005740 [Kickxella alabastrina]|uniref:Uncharacterized protein n=1 Tax=Kickxella alabastrina TaxID=61397 RepID=A0ACC1IDI3_9FUNG|nr:hypothetical protein LPJ66_005740 [Kickxella alabastrina]